MHQSGYITFGSKRFHFLRFGNGKKLIITFHGYGNDASIFAIFHSYLPDHTIISVDLPYHGGSEWTEEKQLEKADLIELVQELMKETNVERVNLAGYSIGARACLCITELMPEHIDKILLIAPDGLVPNTLYSFVTRNALGKWLFKDFLTKPSRYMYLINLLNKINLVNDARYKFAMHYISNEAGRDLLLRVWPNLGHIVPDKKKLREAIKKYKLPVHIFIGRRDKVILIRYGEEFKKGLETVQLAMVEKGHWLMDEETVSKMAKSLQT